MTKDYLMSVAKTIQSQLLALNRPDVIASWGIHKFMAIPFKEMPALAIQIRARLFQGDVIVAYNEMDYYEIYLRDSSGIRCINKEACADEMGDSIDRAIERGDNIAEYRKFCRAQVAKLIG